MMNPAARGLFRRAILQSGSANAPWAFTDPKKDAEAKALYAR